MRNRQSGGLGAHDVRGTSALRGPEWNGDYSPTSSASGAHRCTACQFVKDLKSVVEGGTIAMKNKVIVKDRDEWSSLANFIGNIIAKYADEIDFDSLPDPDVYLQKRYIYESYKAYMRYHHPKTK